jgi:hypothetical protein
LALVGISTLVISCGAGSWWLVVLHNWIVLVALRWLLHPLGNSNRHGFMWLGTGVLIVLASMLASKENCKYCMKIIICILIGLRDLCFYVLIVHCSKHHQRSKGLKLNRQHNKQHRLGN